MSPVTDIQFNQGVEFNAVSAVDDGTNRIHAGDHGFSDDLAVVYDSRGNDPIVGLTDGTTYFVRYVNDDTIELAGTAGGSALPLSSPSFPANHALTPLTSVLTGTGSITFDLTVGIDLRQSSEFRIAPPLPISGDARVEVPSDGKLTEDLQFNLILNNDFDNPFPVTVSVSDTSTNGSVDDLVMDVQQKVDESIVGGAALALGFNYAKGSDSRTNSITAVAAPSGFNLPEIVFGLSINEEEPLPVLLPAANHANLTGLKDNLQLAVDIATVPRLEFQGLDIEDDIVPWFNHGLQTGDEVLYIQGQNDDIGLTTMTSYYVVVEDRDSIKLASDATNAADGVTLPLTPTGIAAHMLAQVSAPSLVTVSEDGTVLSMALANPAPDETLAFERLDSTFSRGDVQVAKASDDPNAIEFGGTTSRIDALVFSKGAVAGTPLPKDGVLSAAANFTLFVDGTAMNVMVNPDSMNADRLAVLTGATLTGSTLTDGTLSEDAFLAVTYQLKDGTKQTANVNVALSDARAIGFDGTETSASGVIEANVSAPADPVLGNDMTFGLSIDGADPVLVLLTRLVTEDNFIQPLGFDDTAAPATVLQASAGLDQFALDDDISFSLAIGGGSAVNVTVPAATTQESIAALASTDATIVNAATNTIQIPGHSFIDGQAVLYDTAGAAPIEGLTSGQTYFIANAMTNSIQLAGPGGSDTTCRRNGRRSAQLVARNGTAEFLTVRAARWLIHSTTNWIFPPRTDLPTAKPLSIETAVPPMSLA